MIQSLGLSDKEIGIIITAVFHVHCSRKIAQVIMDKENMKNTKIKLSVMQIQFLRLKILDEIHSRLDNEEKMGQLEETATETIQNETQRKKIEKINESPVSCGTNSVRLKHM